MCLNIKEIDVWIQKGGKKCLLQIKEHGGPWYESQQLVFDIQHVSRGI